MSEPNNAAKLAIAAAIRQEAQRDIQWFWQDMQTTPGTYEDKQDTALRIAYAKIRYDLASYDLGLSEIEDKEAHAKATVETIRPLLDATTDNPLATIDSAFHSYMREIGEK